VLQRACRARFNTESALLGGDDEAIAAGLTPEMIAAGLAAMRAVLEGHRSKRTLNVEAARAYISEFRDYMRQMNSDFKRRDEMVSLLHAFVDAYDE
jgi:hypothetical protein